MSTFTYQDLRHEYRLTDSGDAWGSAMCWLFAIADELHHRDGKTPAGWEYRPSPCGPSNDADAYETEVVANTDSETLVRFGNVLNRYTAKLKRAGRDY